MSSGLGMGKAPARPKGDVVSVSMSRAEREAFLAEVHVGVLAVAAGPGRGPLVTPVWYSSQPGGLLSVTTGGNNKAGLSVQLGVSAFVSKMRHRRIST